MTRLSKARSRISQPLGGEGEGKEAEGSLGKERRDQMHSSSVGSFGGNQATAYLARLLCWKPVGEVHVGHVPHARYRDLFTNGSDPTDVTSSHTR